MSDRTPEQIEADLDGIGALVNLHHALTGEDCPRHLAVGMTTAAVSALRIERDALVAHVAAMQARLDAVERERREGLCLDKVAEVAVEAFRQRAVAAVLEGEDGLGGDWDAKKVAELLQQLPATTTEGGE